MADKVRGALHHIDWSKSNQASVNVRKKPKQPQQPTHNQKPSTFRDSVQNQAPATVTSSTEGSDIPVNRYRSIVAPVKSGKDEEKIIHRPTSTGSGPQRGRHTYTEQDGEKDESVQVYLGFLGSMKVPQDQASTGIVAIQTPMRQLYFPYRQNQAIAQERVINLKSSGLELYYMPHPDADEPATLAIDWKSILYVEPLKFSTKKSDKDKKHMRAAFEPCESQRLAMLGNRDSLFTPLSKQHQHISLLKHPALLCMVVLGDNELYTHCYICSTVEESVFLARQIRDELEMIRRESIRSGQRPPPMLSNGSTRTDNGYKIAKQQPSGSQSKLKAKHKLHKKQDKGTYSTHTDGDTNDSGTFHFGLSLESSANSMTSPERAYEPSSDDEEMQNSINENFMIGRPGAHNEQRQKSRHSTFSELDTQSDPVGLSHSRSYKSDMEGRPVGVVQPAVRDGFKVLPTDLTADKTRLRPTALNVKTKHQSEVTPELDLKLRMRQKEQGEPFLSSLAPRSVVNPLADADPEQHRKSYISPTPGPISKMSLTTAFNPAAALPQSSWHESVIGNYKSKEKIDNRLMSQMVDTKELPKMKSDKKEMEMANLFSGIDIEGVANNNLGEDNFTMATSGPTCQLHEAMGFMP